MSDDGFVLELALVGVLILVNGFFAAAEMAVLTARRSRLQALVEQGNARARAALRLKSDPDRFLATVQIGVTVVGTLASAVGGVAAIERIEPLLGSVIPGPWASAIAEPIAVATVVATIAYLSLVVGELVPKGVAVRNPEVWAMRLAATVEAISHVTRGAVTMLSASSRLCLRVLGVKGPHAAQFHTLEDLRMIADEAQEQGVVRGGLVSGALEFHERQVREVLTPRHRVVGLPVRATLHEALKMVRESGHSRFPVYDRGTEDVIGFVYAREIYDAALRDRAIELGRLARSPLIVPETRPATELLAEMRKSGVPVAVAVDEHGSVTGLLTVEDLVEVIVGEIPDEHVGAEALVEVLADGSVDADGSVPVHELADDYGLALPESPEYVSVAGLVLERLGTLPHPGQEIAVASHLITVVRMEGPRIRRVRIVRQPPDGAAAEGAGTTAQGSRNSA